MNERMVSVPSEPTEAMIEAAANAPFSEKRKAATNVYDRRIETVADMLRAGIAAAPVREEGGAVDGWIRWDGGDNPIPGQSAEIRLRSGDEFTGSDLSDNVTWKHIWGEGDIIAYRLATREEASAEAGEDYRHLASKIGVVISNHGTNEQHEAWLELLRAFNGFRPQPQAREEAQPWAYGWYDSGGGKRVYAYLPTVSAFPEANAFPLYTHPAPDALRVAVEALKTSRENMVGWFEAIDAEVRVEHEMHVSLEDDLDVIDQALAALQQEGRDRG